jgi:hypothetical protein
VLEGLERKEAADAGAEIGHVVVVLVAEINDLLEIRFHDCISRGSSCANDRQSGLTALIFSAAMTAVQLLNCHAKRELRCNRRASASLGTGEPRLACNLLRSPAGFER